MLQKIRVVIIVGKNRYNKIERGYNKMRSVEEELCGTRGDWIAASTEQMVYDVSYDNAVEMDASITVKELWIMLVESLKGGRILK